MYVCTTLDSYAFIWIVIPQASYEVGWEREWEMDVVSVKFDNKYLASRTRPYDDFVDFQK